jgi:hypothetical protein
VNITELKPNLLVQDGREVLQVSSVYSTRATLQLVYPKPPRTTVRTYSEDVIADRVKPASALFVKRYEDAWGLAPLPKKRSR